MYSPTIEVQDNLPPIRGDPMHKQCTMFFNISLGKSNNGVLEVPNLH